MEKEQGASFKPMTQQQMAEAWKVSRVDICYSCQSSMICGHVDPSNPRSQLLYRPELVLKNLEKRLDDRVKRAQKQLDVFLERKLFIKWWIEAYSKNIDEEKGGVVNDKEKV